jgi:hypothetical protein
VVEFAWAPLDDPRVRSTRTALLLLGALTFALPARAEEQFLAVSEFSERGRNTKGDAAILAATLEWELTGSGAFEAVADRDSKTAARDVIAKTNKHRTDEKYWIELGQEVGASHLLRGEVWESPAACFARAKLITLKTSKTKVSSAEAYDCTEADLKAVAGDLSLQLAGKRASKATPRKPRIEKVEAPLDIVMDEGETYVNGRPIVRPEAPDPAEPPAAPALPPKEVQPPTSPAPPAPAGDPEIDLEKWPGFAPRRGDGGPVYTTFELARDIHERQPLVAGIILVIPVLFAFLGAIAVRIHHEVGALLMRIGLSISVMIVCLMLTAAGFWWYGLERLILDDLDLLLFASPFLAILAWLIGGRLVVTYAEMEIGRRILSVFLFTAYFSVVLLVASQIQIPVLYLGIATAAFWLSVKVATSARKKRLRAAAA